MYNDFGHPKDEETKEQKIYITCLKPCNQVKFESGFEPRPYGPPELTILNTINGDYSFQDYSVKI